MYPRAYQSSQSIYLTTSTLLAMRLWRTMKQPSWQQITDQRTKKRQRPRHMYAQERTKLQGQRLGTGVVPWRPWRVRHCRSIIIQASTWATLFKNDSKYFERGGLRRTTTFKEQGKNAVGRSTLPKSGETLTHQSYSLVKKESKTDAYRYRLDGYGDTPG